MTGLNSTYDDAPERYDALRACWLNDRREAFLAERLVRLDSEGPLSVAEIGSGTGWLLGRLAERFPRWSFHGIEPIGAYVDYARGRYGKPNLTFSQGSAEAPPAEIGGGSLDCLLSNDVLHHVVSEEGAVRQAARLARPGARWIAIEPNALNPYAFAGQSLKPGERNFWPKRFAAVAHQEGWVLAGRRYLFLIPPFVRSPPSWLVHLERRLEPVPVLAGGVVLELVYRPEENGAVSAAAD